MKLEKSVLRKIIKEEILKFITEAEDEKYTHIGYGKYKLKGKEDDKSSPTFTKDDSGKYIPTKSDKGGKGQEKPKVNIFDKPKQKPQEKKPKSDPPKVPSSKLTDLLPNANPETFDEPSDINKIPDSQKMEVSMKIDKLAELAKQAKEKGEAAPNFNLCEITIPGTNLYCEGNAGIPREQMPQFKGTPTPGSPASKLPKDNSGEVDTEPMFRAMLKKKGIKTVETEIPSDKLKATQSELVGAKVAGMTQALEEDPNHPGITAPIYVTRDGYVVDGHHRWAAMTSYAMKTGKPANMRVIVIDDDVENVIPMANQFAEDIGVAAKKADTKQEGLTEATFVAAYNGQRGVFAHEFKARDIKDALQRFIDMYKVPKSDWDKIKLKKTSKGLFGLF